ncbi:MAG: 1-deoxy-D-xylulose-5-phosphate reductoisomerase [Victivallales bacterium]|nr:1-deoxy-D-xylulose-5-phosphate reductoisomerase [Victivallales bacterium]
MKKKRIVILGATGSVGRSAADVAEHLAAEIEVIGIAARNNLNELARQAAALHCRYAVSSNPAVADELRRLVPESCRTATGDAAMIELVTRPEVDMVLCAIVGTGGLEPVLAAIRAGKDIAIASKEILVMAGEIVMAEAAAHRVKLLPVDSEHSAIFQCLDGRNPAEVKQLILTASGGPFRRLSAAQLAEATLDMALRHPTWSMGPKVTIDSASMMNKALEVIEAKWLFGVMPEQIGVVIHPQSLIHSMVEFVDGTILAQMSTPDMRFPIQCALTWPCKRPGGMAPFDFRKFCELTFELPDRRRFPSLDFAFEALREGGTLPAVMNAANEVAVARFCRREIKFDAIWQTIGNTMAAHEVITHPALAEIIAADAWARDFAMTAV